MSLIAGVIDSTTNYVEHPEVVADRIERVARVVGDPHRIMGGRTAALKRPPAWVMSLKNWCGRSCALFATAPPSPRSDCSGKAPRRDAALLIGWAGQTVGGLRGRLVRHDR